MFLERFKSKGDVNTGDPFPLGCSEVSRVARLTERP